MTTTASAPLPRVGIGVMIFRDGKVLLARRKGSHGAGAYAFPGGHLEYGESFDTCARREVREECGIDIQNIEFLFVANILDFMPKHYVHLTLTADWAAGEPQVLEPEKSESWGWFELSNLPAPLFKPCQMSVESYLKGGAYYDSVS